MATSRTIYVDPARLSGWVQRFGAAHGGLESQDAGPLVRLRTPDGYLAELSVAGPGPEPTSPAETSTGPTSPEDTGPEQTNPEQAAARLVLAASTARRAGIILIRRGGYAVGVTDGVRLTAHKSGTRYVQSRTAAGGWSQQRFARRRANQADALVETVAAHAARIIDPAQVDYLAVGGDKVLIEAVLNEPVCRGLRALPAVSTPDIGDPRLAVLQETAAALVSVQITITDPR